MIGILGGMGTQAGLDFCNKLAILNRGKIDQDYPLFVLYNKSNIPGRPESIGIHTGKIVNMNILPSTPKCSGVPFPCFPTKPVAWQSSTITSASYCSAN